MPSSPRPTLLVIPAFRESRRLPKFLPELCEAVAGLDGDSLAIRVVDDGSGSAEQKVVRDLVAELRERHAFLQEPLILERNLGKGGAVYAGWDASQGEGFAHIGFVDADGAARLHDDDQSIKRTLIRKWLGLLFRRITRMFFKLPVNDTQCGFKFIPAEPYHQIREHLTELRYCFDIDLTIHLLKAGVKIKEISISWTETPGTKLTLSQATKMLSSLWQLRKKVD